MAAAHSSVLMKHTPAPTLDDARRAAEAVLRETPKAQVLLYGSVAKGDATPLSDIDLYVLYADIEYANRESLTRRLKDAVKSTLNGQAFDLYVSDLPEWEGRVAVTSTFEHEISEDVVVVGGSLNRDDARWGKTQVRPMTAHEEAQQYLEGTLEKQIYETIRDVTPPPTERPRLGSPLLGADADEQNEELKKQARSERNRLNRICDAVSSCAMMIEKSLKAATTLQGNHPPTHKQIGHDIEVGLSKLANPLQDELRLLLTKHGLTSEDISEWRVKGTYPHDSGIVNTEADTHLYRYLDTAIDVTSRVIQEYEVMGVSAEDAHVSLEELQEVRKRGRVRWEDEVDKESWQYPQPTSDSPNVIDDGLASMTMAPSVSPAPLRPSGGDKKAEAVRLRRAGHTLREIGGTLGMSASWARNATKGVKRGTRRRKSRR